MDPFLKVGEQLTALFNNRPTSTRESMADDYFSEAEGRIKANLVFAWVDQSMANLADRSPIFSVRPNSATAEGGDAVVKNVINHRSRETGQIMQDRSPRCPTSQTLCSMTPKTRTSISQRALQPGL